MPGKCQDTPGIPQRVLVECRMTDRCFDCVSSVAQYTGDVNSEKCLFPTEGAGDGVFPIGGGQCPWAEEVKWYGALTSSVR